MMRQKYSLVVSALLVLQACTSSPPIEQSSKARQRGPTEADVRSAYAALPVYDRLEPFATNAEFTSYLRRLIAIDDRYHLAGLPHGDKPPILLAQQAQPCDPAVEDCEGLQEVSVTGSRVTSKQSITNNQVAGVDEGDIVKSWGRFLLILHDARLFSVDLGEKPGQARLVDRVDAYQDSKTDAWYDELLIHGNRVLVTGYSYDAEQTEVSIFDIDSRGHLKLTMRFFIQSEDYFSGGNYASRLVDGKLVIYTPIPVENLQDEKRPKFPRIRSWTPGKGFTSWQNLLSATDIYRPVDRSLSPTLHAISVCPILSRAAAGCESRGILAPGNRELYVSPEAAYLWVNNESENHYRWYGWRECDEGDPKESAPVQKATLYQFPFDEIPLKAVRAQGDPPDQFSMERRDSMFHALVRRIPERCYRSEESPLEFLSFPMRQFSEVPQPIGASRVHAAPGVGPGYVSARFAKDYLTYGSGGGWWRVYWRDKEPLEDTRQLVTIPLREPDKSLTLALSHSIERVELLGDNVVAFGVTVNRALGVTTVDLRSKPVLAGTLELAGVAESEGRSHAFNAEVQADGSAVLGLPTAVMTGDRNRWGYEQFKEHVHFFTATSALRLNTNGSVPGDQLPDNPAYKCEVSCVDWYGNARPIFYQGRTFALLGREFVEARLLGGSMQEIGRIDLTLVPVDEKRH
jgi:hypothetical protein